MKINSEVCLKYKLSRKQRLFNPVEKPIYVFLAFLGFLVFMVSMIVKEIILIAISFQIILLFFFRRAILAFVADFVDKSGERIVVINENYVGFGRNKAEYWIENKSLKLDKGLFKTMIISNPFGLKLIVNAELVLEKNLENVLDVKKN